MDQETQTQNTNTNCTTIAAINEFRMVAKELITKMNEMAVYLEAVKRDKETLLTTEVLPQEMEDIYKDAESMSDIEMQSKSAQFNYAAMQQQQQSLAQQQPQQHIDSQLTIQLTQNDGTLNIKLNTQIPQAATYIELLKQQQSDFSTQPQQITSTLSIDNQFGDEYNQCNGQQCAHKSNSELKHSLTNSTTITATTLTPTSMLSTPITVTSSISKTLPKVPMTTQALRKCCSRDCDSFASNCSCNFRMPSTKIKYPSSESPVKQEANSLCTQTMASLDDENKLYSAQCACALKAPPPTPASILTWSDEAAAVAAIDEPIENLYADNKSELHQHHHHQSKPVHNDDAYFINQRIKNLTGASEDEQYV